MARRPARAPLDVFLNGRHVGVLRRESTGAIDFRYAPDWLGWSEAFPVSLSLPLREDRYIGQPVLNVFDNLLPDSEPIRRRIAERVGAEGADAFSLLTALGHDCVGALQFLTEGTDPGPAGAVHGTPIDEAEIAGILANLATAPLGVGMDREFRISIAGAQEKTALLRHEGRWLRPTSTTATTHILKPRIGQLPNGMDLSDSVANEYFCLKLLEGFGLPVARAEMAEFDGLPALVVERFDRRWTRDGRLLRLPQEDACQALSVPPTRKYQSEGGPGMREIIGLLKGSDTPEADIAAFLRANILFWMLGATDGHAKNFSIFLAPGGRYRLAPLYDVMTVQPSVDTGRVQRRAFRLAMSVGRNRHYAVDEIAPRHFVQTAEMSGVGAAVVQAIFAELASQAERQAAEVAAALPHGFPDRLVDSVMAAIARRARLLAL